jgi:TolB protein
MRKLDRYLVLLLVGFVWLLTISSASAQVLTGSVQGMMQSATPIAVVPYAQPGMAPLPTDVADVIRADLNRCGKFRALAKSDIVELPAKGSDINFGTWRLLKQDYITVGHLSDAGNGMVRVDYELWDVNRQQNLLAGYFAAPAGDLRGVAHQIADAIYQKITGVRGAFWTRIAYITQTGLGDNTNYALVVADSDGFNPQVVARSRESLMSPSWSPDGRKIAYVSFESGNSQIYVQDLTTGARELVEAHKKGINGAPAWSPDGSKLAVALSFTGHLQLYVLDVGSRHETQLTHDTAINTEPVWSPDGQSIYFTSDRSGRPQIYQIPAGGGSPQRISFQGSYNSNSSISYDGKELAMVQGNGNVYRIAVMDLGLGGQVHYLSPGPLDFGPSWAPNASMLLYGATEGPRGVLYATSSDGMVRQRLALANGSVSDPSWGPYRQQQ